MNFHSKYCFFVHFAQCLKAQKLIFNICKLLIPNIVLSALLDVATQHKQHIRHQMLMVDGMERRQSAHKSQKRCTNSDEPSKKTKLITFVSLERDLSLVSLQFSSTLHAISLSWLCMRDKSTLVLVLGKCHIKIMPIFLSFLSSVSPILVAIEMRNLRQKSIKL